MNKKILVLVGVAVLFLVGGYFSIRVKKNVIDTNTPSQIISTDKKIKDINDFYSITAVYPNDGMDKDKKMEQFVAYKVAQMKEEWKVGGKAYAEEMHVAKDFPDRPKMKYEYDISYKKYESKVKGTVSYVFSIYEFTGGANGNITVTTFTFDKNGVVAIDAMLNLAQNDNDIALSRVLAETALTNTESFVDKTMLYEGLGLSYLKADGKTLDKVKCHCDGFFFGSNFQNFIVKDEGITFVFNKYQVAPGSSGLPEVTLSWDTLKSYMSVHNGPTTQMGNPASLNCVKVGGKVIIQKRGDGGEYGLCYFDDNRACEEWALMRGDCPVGGRRTTGYDTIDQNYCAWVGGQTFAVENSICTFKNGSTCSTKAFYNGTCSPTATQ